MYKKNFKSRAEAYAYTEERITLVKNPEKLIANYNNALHEYPPLKPKALVLQPSKEVYHAFNVRTGAPYEQILINGNGEVTI